MSENQNQKITIKKSEYQIHNGFETKQQEQQTANNIQNQSIDKDVENLLDLTEDQAQKKKQYEIFIKDRIVNIEGPELVTENVIKSYKLYKIKTRKKDMDEFDTCVSRRFSDFQYLQKQLVDVYGGFIIPVLPEKNIWANINMEGQQQISNRARGLEKYLKLLLKHAKIRTSQEVRNFLFENQIKFSQKKGEFYSKIKTQQKIKQIAINAYSIGRDLVTKYINWGQQKHEENLQIIKPSVEDIRLMEHQREVSDLIKVINVLRKIVQNSVLEMKMIGVIIPDSKQASFQSLAILNKFQDLCKYVFSCNEALTRRHLLRLQIDHLNTQYQSIQKKIKTNPRSQQVDMLRNKIAKTTQKCEKWTISLLQQLQQSISVGRSMVQNFINQYSAKKQQFYDL